jgi:hypothetical protein
VSKTSERVGDEAAGFSFSFEPSPPALHVRGWGFWNVEVASSFGSKIRDACRNRPPGTTLHLDMRDLRPMREEGQISFGALLEALGSLGIQRTVIATGSSMTKLQLLRLVMARAKQSNVEVT